MRLALLLVSIEPGGNLTGVTSLNVELTAKRLELLHDVIPDVKSIAALVNPNSPTAESINGGLPGRPSLGLQLHIQQAARTRDRHSVCRLGQAASWRAFPITANSFFDTRREQRAALSSRYAAPAISYSLAITAAGGLMSYGDNFVDAYRLSRVYAGRILKGEKRADLPVQQLAKFDLAINLKTARALGIDIPPKVLALADQVFE